MRIASGSGTTRRVLLKQTMPFDELHQEIRGG